jgi:hypothetical protein
MQQRNDGPILNRRVPNRDHPKDETYGARLQFKIVMPRVKTRGLYGVSEAPEALRWSREGTLGSCEAQVKDQQRSFSVAVQRNAVTASARTKAWQARVSSSRVVTSTLTLSSEARESAVGRRQDSVIYQQESTDYFGDSRAEDAGGLSGRSL